MSAISRIIGLYLNNTDHFLVLKAVSSEAFAALLTAPPATPGAEPAVWLTLECFGLMNFSPATVAYTKELVD